MTKSLLCFAAALLLLGLSNPSARSQDQPAPARQAPPDPAIERGHTQFAQSCGFCHGADATGARGPDLVRSPLVAHDVKGDLIGDVIRHGRPDKGMPPLSLSDAQVADIAAYLHNRAAEALNSGEVPKTYPVEKLLTGDVGAGKTLFDGPGGCKKCHSTDDLAAAGRKYPPLELEARMLYPEGKHAVATVRLPSGEQIQGPLVHIDEFSVSLRDSSGWYRSFSRDRVKVDVQNPLDAHRDLLPKLTQADVHNLFAYLQSLK
jgi:cytochrome c oxidase cbb3-type subunit III